MSHNQIYKIIDVMRGKTKKDKFDYQCSENNEDLEYLNLDCEEAKILKYLLKSQLKSPTGIINDNILNKNLLIGFLTQKKDLSTNIRKQIKEILYNRIKKISEDPNINIKAHIEQSQDSQEEGQSKSRKRTEELDDIRKQAETKKTEIKQFKILEKIKQFKILEKINKLITLIDMYKSTYIQTNSINYLLVVLYLLPHFAIVHATSSAYQEYAKRQEQKKIASSQNTKDTREKLEKMKNDELYSLKLVFEYMWKIINQIIPKLDKLPDNIQATNICVNGKSITDKKTNITSIQPRKCDDRDYKNIPNLSTIKRILSQLDAKIDEPAAPAPAAPQ